MGIGEKGGRRTRQFYGLAVLVCLSTTSYFQRGGRQLAVNCPAVMWHTRQQHKMTPGLRLPPISRVANVLLAMIILMIAVDICQAQSRVRVRGYFKKDGTYVRPHYRTAPDGIPYNNYSFPGNYNPNTGRITTGDPAKYLERYYRDKGGLGIVRGSNTWSVSDLQVARLPRMPDEVVVEEFIRSQRYCSTIYERGSEANRGCEARQLMGLGAVSLPDYSDYPEVETGRSARYCEFLYGDDRSGFYNCLNRQLFGLEALGAEFETSDYQDEARSREYCEFLYGDDRAGAAACLQRQAKGLKGPSPTGEGIPDAEWNRSVSYCNFLYGNDRAGNQNCLKRQKQGLSQSLPTFSTIPSSESNRSRRYCEFLYGNDRAGNRNCLTRQASGLEKYFQNLKPTISTSSRSRSYCESLYGDDRAGFWSCLARR